MNKPKVLKVEKCDDSKWLNLFKIDFENTSGEKGEWFFASRKDNPLCISKDSKTDAVVIVPFNIETGNLILLKEFRYPLNDYEYHFPAGLIDENETIDEAIQRELKEETGLDFLKTSLISPPVYSASGLTDESSVIAFVECKGNISTEYNEKDECIEILEVRSNDIKKLFEDKTKKFGAKTWLILYTNLMLNNLFNS